MASYDLGDITVDVEFSHITPRDYWDNRYEMFNKIKDSMNFYEGLSYDERNAIERKVKRALAIMYDNVSHWIPDSFSIDNAGDRIKIELNLMVADIDQDIEDSHLATSFELASAAKTLKEIIEEVEEEDVD